MLLDQVCNQIRSGLVWRWIGIVRFAWERLAAENCLAGFGCPQFNEGTGLGGLEGVAIDDRSHRGLGRLVTGPEWLRLVDVNN